MTLYIFVCSVLTPYFDEPVLFSRDHLGERNEDGVSILFYLQKIFPGFCISSRYICKSTAWPKQALVFIFKSPRVVIICITTLLLLIWSWISLDEWKNFLERFDCKSEEELKEELDEELRLWASYRGQTLTKTGTNCFLALWQYSYMLDM